MDEQEAFKLPISRAEEFLLVNQEYRNSAFIRFTSNHSLPTNNDCHRNANKKMIEFLKNKGREMLTEQGLKHKLKERIRRQMHNQHYATLHKFLPLETKGDQKSILEMAIKKIGELTELRKETEMKWATMNTENNKSLEMAEIKLRVTNPASGIDSMLEVLECLKNTPTTATSIQATFSQHEFAAVLEIETKMKAADVEVAVQKTLFKAEKKFRNPN